MSSGKWVTGQKGQGEDVGEGPFIICGFDALNNEIMAAEEPSRHRLRSTLQS